MTRIWTLKTERLGWEMVAYVVLLKCWFIHQSSVYLSPLPLLPHQLAMSAINLMAVRNWLKSQYPNPDLNPVGKTCPRSFDAILTCGMRFARIGMGTDDCSRAGRAGFHA